MLWTFALATTGFGLLGASLAVQKKAVWLAGAGGILLAALALGESDPLLFLGALACAVARVLPPPKKRPLPQDGPRTKGLPAARQP